MLYVANGREKDLKRFWRWSGARSGAPHHPCRHGYVEGFQEQLQVPVPPSTSGSSTTSLLRDQASPGGAQQGHRAAPAAKRFRHVLAGKKFILLPGVEAHVRGKKAQALNQILTPTSASSRLICSGESWSPLVLPIEDVGPQVLRRLGVPAQMEPSQTLLPLCTDGRETSRWHPPLR